MNSIQFFELFNEHQTMDLKYDLECVNRHRLQAARELMVPIEGGDRELSDHDVVTFLQCCPPGVWDEEREQLRLLHLRIQAAFQERPREIIELLKL